MTQKIHVNSITHIRLFLNIVQIVVHKHIIVLVGKFSFVLPHELIVLVATILALGHATVAVNRLMAWLQITMLGTKSCRLDGPIMLGIVDAAWCSRLEDWNCTQRPMVQNSRQLRARRDVCVILDIENNFWQFASGNNGCRPQIRCATVIHKSRYVAHQSRVHVEIVILE